MAEKPVETAVVFSEKPIEIQPVFSEEGAAEIRVSKKITPFGKLPGLGFSPIFLDKKTPPTAEKLIKPIAAKGTKKWQFGVGAGMQTIGFQRFNGHATGFLAERKLAARTRLTAGLGWSRTVLASNPVSSSNLFVLVNHSDYLSATNDLTLNFTAPEKSVAEYDPMTNSYSNIQLAISANVLHRLEMPLILTHKIGSRWYFGAGFSGSWQFMARSVIGAKSLEYEKAGSYENFNSAAPAAPTSDISSSRQVNKLLTRKLPNFDIAAVGFAGLDLSKKWCATAQFQQGLLNQTALPGLDKQLYSARVSIIRWF